MKKKTQKSTENAYGFTQVMSMLENMNDGISVIAKKQVELSDQVKEVKEKVDNLEVKVDNLEVKVDNLEVKVDRIDARLARVEDDVVDIKHNLSEKVDREEFNKLEKRMVKLEKLVFAKIG